MAIKIKQIQVVPVPNEYSTQRAISCAVRAILNLSCHVRQENNVVRNFCATIL